MHEFDPNHNWEDHVASTIYSMVKYSKCFECSECGELHRTQSKATVCYIQHIIDHGGDIDRIFPGHTLAGYIRSIAQCVAQSIDQNLPCFYDATEADIKNLNRLQVELISIADSINN